MSGSFTKKAIRLAFTLGQSGNTKVINDLACEVSVRKAGLPDKNEARAKVWGLSYESMAQLATLTWKPLESRHNLISIEAGDKGGMLSVVFQGEVTRASADFNAAPDVCMEFEAESGAYPQQAKLPAATVDGEVPVEPLFEQFAAQAGYSFRNEGVSASVRNVCFVGSPYDKLRKLARHLGCDLFIDDGLVVAAPAGQARSGGTVTLSKDTGLIGYPTFTQDGISCRCLYNPALVHGGLVKVQSMVPRASGIWRITGLSHNLAADTPHGGSWESRIEAVYNE